MHTALGNFMHMSVDCLVDNAVPGLWLPGGIGGARGQVQPRPAAVDELLEVPGQPFSEIVVVGSGADRRLDGRRVVDAERDRPYLPRVALRTVVPLLHGSDLARAGVAGHHPPVGPLPFPGPGVRTGPGVLPVGRPERVKD